MRRQLLLALVNCLLAVLYSRTVTAETPISTVQVGNAGNINDTHGNGFGAVPYAYRIGTFEVTNAQYAEFLNAVDPAGVNALGLYNNRMSLDARGGIEFSDVAVDGAKYELKPGRGNNPVILVSWYDAARFSNWLHNGQGDGGTETGAYTLLGGTPSPSNGTQVVRSPDAKWFLPTENEWYKAAYHKNNGPTGDYWDYATSTNNEPYSDQPPGSDAPDQSNTANFRKYDAAAYNFDLGYAVTGSPVFEAEQNYLTDVGSFLLSSSPYGTFDQGGNVWEWNEDGALTRGGRGGFWSSSSFNLHAARRSEFVPDGEFNDVGFRVATVPEPNFLALVGTGLGAVLFCGRRRRR